MKKVENEIAMRRASGQLMGSTLRNKKKHGWPRIQPASSGLELVFWSFYKVDGESKQDKSHSVCTLCHTQIKSWFIIIVGPWVVVVIESSGA